MPPVTDPALAARLLEAAIGQAHRRDRPDLRDRLVRERDRLAAPGCLVVVVGEFKKGKGTLVNALLGARVVATGPVATTAVATVVRYAPRPGIRAVARNPDLPDGATETSDPRPGGEGAQDFAQRVEDIHARAVEPPASPRAAAAGDDGAGHLARVEAALPRRLLADGLVLMDTPGLAGGLSDARAAGTLRSASEADAVLLVTDASQELTAPEIQTLRRLADLGLALLVAVTKCDVYPRWRDIVTTDRTHLARAGLDLPVFALAAPLRHHALLTGDAGLDAESGYPALAAHLRAEVVGGRRARLAAGAGEAARDALRHLLAELRTQRQALLDPAGGPGADAGLATAEQQARRLADASASWRRALAERSATMSVLLRDDLERRLVAVETEVEQRIKVADPAREWDDLRGALHQRTNDALLGHRMQLRSQLSMAVDAVLREFEGGSAQVRALLDTAVNQPLTPVDTAGDPDFHQLRGLDTLMYGARAGGVGMLLVSAAGTVATVVGATAATMSLALAPVGLGLVFFLGRRSVASLRQNELRAHRAEATRAVRDYLATVRRIASADSVATRVQIERAVGDALGELAAELTTSAVRNREAAASATRVSSAERQSRLAAVDADIAALLGAARAATAALPAPTGTEQ